MFVGYQAAGTRGRSLVDGEKAAHKGRDVPVEATIEHVDSMSAHADAGEIMRWLRFVAAPTMTYLVHGEPVALDASCARPQDKQWPALAGIWVEGDLPELAN